MPELKDEGPENPEDSPSWDSERVLGAIEYLRTCGDFDWADDSLRGIGETIEEKGMVSEGQLRAIQNIVYGFIKRRGRSSGYERPSDLDRCLDVLD